MTEAPDPASPATQSALTSRAAPAPVPQPFLHELVTCVRAPVVAMSGTDGQIRPGGVQGLFHRDDRVISELVVDVDQQEPVPIGHDEVDAGTARFVGAVRHLGDPILDPTVWLERARRVSGDGLTERLVLVNASRQPVTATVRVHLGVDFAQLGAVKHAEPTRPVRPVCTNMDRAEWSTERVQARLHVSGRPTLAVDDRQRLRIRWQVSLPPHQQWVAALSMSVSSHSPNPSNSFRSVPDGFGWGRVSVTGPPELARLVERGLSDLAALMLSDPRNPTDLFPAAGSPWFLTLFGRDALWATRMMLPLGTGPAAGTLRALARRQGVASHPATGEAPGRILHEIRDATQGVGGLPAVYFGTVDATPLWISLLRDAWRWGMPEPEVAELLDPLTRALRYLLEEADADGDGFLEYVDATGRGLTNQGWKDSGDAIQFPDGTLATPPIALAEAQAYGYEAALAGAELLEAFGHDGATELRTWAAQLRQRFHTTFWVTDSRGSFPAIALEGAKIPVPTAASNLGHLLGTGLLDPDQAATVAARLAEPDLDCGYGLRTMSADATGFNPLGYHTGTVWPHDTAIAIWGLAREGLTAVAGSLAAGLTRVAPAFSYRLPELFAGTDARAGEPVLAYPAACRPQAWSAASAVTLLVAALGLAADVPAGTLTVYPAPEFGSWFPLRLRGLRVAGHPLAVAVDASGQVEVETTAPLEIRTR
jgi:glycogen debranching enzyme